MNEVGPPNLAVAGGAGGAARKTADRAHATCNKWRQFGACQYGSACWFAHGNPVRRVDSSVSAAAAGSGAAAAAGSGAAGSIRCGTPAAISYPVCVVDALNIGRWRGKAFGVHGAGKPQVKVCNIVDAVKLITEKGMRPIVMLPQSFLSNKKGLALTDKPEKLRHLEEQGYLEVLPAGLDDDVAIIERAKSFEDNGGGFVLTNDLFRDHQRNARITRSWYQQRVFRFSGNKIDGFYLHAPPDFGDATPAQHVQVLAGASHQSPPKNGTRLLIGNGGASTTELMPEAPDELRCPIGFEVFDDPVVAADGHNYERAHIETWVRAHHTSPKTNAILAHKHLNPNFELRARCRAWKEAHPNNPTAATRPPPPREPPSLPTTVASSSTLPSVSLSIVKVWFQATGKHGDYAWMLRQHQYDRVLMIYNENLLQQRDKTSNFAGAGNACARPFRVSGKAIGIPTGHRGAGFQSLHQLVDDGRSTVKQVIDEAIAEIVQHVVIQPSRFDTICYCVNNARENLIGSGMFRIGDSVRTYITAAICSLPEKISSALSSTCGVAPSSSPAAVSRAAWLTHAGSRHTVVSTAAASIEPVGFPPPLPVSHDVAASVQMARVDTSIPFAPRVMGFASSAGSARSPRRSANRPVSWACKSDRGWRAYPMSVSESIEAAYQSGVSDMDLPGYLLARGNDFSYLLCFRSMKQTNQTTGKARPIRQAL